MKPEEFGLSLRAAFARVPDVRSRHGRRYPLPALLTLGEDACQVRSAHAPQALAAGRNAVVGLLHQHRTPNLAAALRTFAWSPASAVLDLLGLSPPQTLNDPGTVPLRLDKPH